MAALDPGTTLGHARVHEHRQGRGAVRRADLGDLPLAQARGLRIGGVKGDPRRGMAGLSLARLLIDTNPAKAARVLRSSLPDMPQALLEDSLARLVEAESRAGNAEAARRAAEDYEARFPNGLRAKDVQRWAER